jgi:sugar O-acyltransferase (sialic acid O-acetyltransferase NeuD family)
MRDLLLLGLGVHGGEMAEIVERINRTTPTWNLLGFLATKAEQVGSEFNGYPVLGTAAALSEYPQAALCRVYGWPNAQALPQNRLATLIDPAAFVSRTAQIGAGSVIYPGCFIGLNARLGDRIFCLSGCVINHDDVIGNDVVFASGVRLAGNVTVESDCYLGQACTVREFTRIGRGSLIGTGAVVVKDVEPNSVMVGNPARRLRARSA